MRKKLESPATNFSRHWGCFIRHTGIPFPFGASTIFFRQYCSAKSYRRTNSSSLSKKTAYMNSAARFSINSRLIILTVALERSTWKITDDSDMADPVHRWLKPGLWIWLGKNNGLHSNTRCLTTLFLFWKIIRVIHKWCHVFFQRSVTRFWIFGKFLRKKRRGRRFLPWHHLWRSHRKHAYLNFDNFFIYLAI